MPNLEAIVEWPGLEAIDSCSVTQSHGPTPSAFSIACFPQKKAPAINGDLTLSYGTFKRTFKDCLLDAASYQFNSGGEIVGLTIFDWRWKWRTGSISGRYNQRKISGKLDGSFYATKRPQDLAKLCLEEMSQSGYDVGEMPNDEYPEISWDYENPASALEQLCTLLGCRIVPLAGNKVKICKTGVGAKLNTALPYEGLSESIDLADQYDAIEVVGAPVVVGVTYPLGCVIQVDEPNQDAKEEGRFWRSLGSERRMISFLPTVGLENDPEGLSVASLKHRGYIKRCFQKWYEPYDEPNSGLYGDLSQSRVATGCKFLTEAGIEEKLDNYRLALPVVQQIPSFKYPGLKEFEQAAQLYAPTIVGDWFDGKDKGANTDNEEVPVPFHIEQSSEHLLVKFQENVYAQFLGALEHPLLFLKAAANILHPKTKSHIRYTYKRKLKTPKGKETVLKLRREDIVLYHGLDAALNKAVLAECDKRANFYIDAKLKEMENRNPQTQIVAEWVDQPLDGAIQVVEWTMGSGGPTTTIHRNDDPGTETTVSYAERQGNIRQAQTDKLASSLAASAVAARRAVQ